MNAETGEERHGRIGGVLETFTEPNILLTGNDDRQILSWTCSAFATR
jgi:hypothetical protein